MEEEFLKKLDCYDTISFDIFDTLIMRRAFYPHDIFLIVEQKAEREKIQIESFCKNRIQAEKNLIAEIPDIYELYMELQRITNISDEDRNELLRLELETERSSLVRRDSVCRLLDYVYEKGKKVFLVSDMYIPREILLKWLAEMGITKFHEAFISYEYHRPKVGGLYDIYKENTAGVRYLHIGDNEIYDGRYAKAAGIDSFLIESASSLMRKCNPFEIQLYIEQRENRIALGNLAAGLYNDPFVDRRKRPTEIKSIYEIVAYAVAPMISGLVLWMIERLSKEKYDGLLLAARDGYLICEMLEIYEEIRGEKLPYYGYFYTSRAAGMAAVIESQADFIQAVRRPAEMPLGQCIEERLEMVADTENADAFYQKNKEKIITQSLEMKRRYLRYVSELKISPKGKYAFFDFVSSGTSLSLLNKILKMSMTGLFCYRYDSNLSKKRLNIESFLDNRQGNRFWEYYKIFETILTSPEGTFLRFDSGGKPVFSEDMRSEMEKILAKEMQAQVLKYWRNFLDAGFPAPPSRELLISMTEFLDSKNVLLSDSKKDILYLYDSFESGKIKVFP